MSVFTDTEDPECSNCYCLAACEKQTQRTFQVRDVLEELADSLPRRQAVIWPEAQCQCKAVLSPICAFVVGIVLPLLLRRYGGPDGNAQPLDYRK